jgi:hypothetical protein
MSDTLVRTSGEVRLSRTGFVISLSSDKLPVWEYAFTDTLAEMVEAEEAKINARKEAANAQHQESESKKPSKESKASQ